MAADDKIFSFGCFKDVDHVGHADDSSFLVEHCIILNLKVLSLS
jgi:hypothetical protein